MFGRKKKKVEAPKKNLPLNDFISGKKEEDLDEKSVNKTEVWEFLALKNEKSRKIFGASLIVVSVFLLVAFISFFNSWKVDQDIISSGEWSVFKKTNPNSIGNLMGILGAWVSYIFVHKGFGVAAVLLLPFPFLLGLGLLTDAKFKLFKWFRLSVFSIVLLSMWFGFLFQSNFQLLGGAFGYHGTSWLRGLIGNIGTGFVLLLSSLIFSILVFDFPKFSKKTEALEGEEDLVDLPESQEGEKELEPEHKEEIEKEETFVKPPVVEEVSSLAKPITLETKVEEKPEEPKKTEEPDPNAKNLSFQVENKLEEEEELDMEIEVPKEEEKVRKIGSLDTTFDPTLELSDFKLPELDLLNEYKSEKKELDTELLENNKNLIVTTLSNYKIEISEIKATVGPTVTLYEIIPAPGVKISKIRSLEDDIALSLAALGIRIIAPIPGKGTVGIEVPNKDPEMVSMKSVLASKKFAEGKYELPIALGKTISNEVFVTDLTKMPHLLMAGATGQGKSVGLNAILVSILYKKHPAFVKFVLVDPKKVELTLFKKIERHYLAKLPGDGEAIITDNSLVVNTLNSLCVEMDDRYKLLQDAHCRNIIEYNKKFIDRKLNPNDGHKFMPYIVVVIDEVADLIMTAGKEVETPIARIAQLARAIGIHLILATQRPSVDIITGKIKANFPARIAFRVMSKIDSRTILDTSGADQLIGRGDMLYVNGSDVIRLQCAFVDTPEVEKITDYIGSQRAYPFTFELPEYVDESSSSKDDVDLSQRDQLFDDAARMVVMTQQGSTSMIQRKLKIGYNRAGRIIDQLEAANIVGPFEGSKARQVLIPDEYALEQYLNELDKQDN